MPIHTALDHPKGEKPYILAIDDELLNLELLKFVLERKGYLFEGKQRLAHFYEALKKKTPDLILLDVIMGGYDGYGLCKELKANAEYEAIPIIFLSGKIKTADKIRGFQSGGVDYITKPFDEHELLARLKTHIDLKRARQKITEQAENLRHDNILKNRIFSIIGHDLRSPLSAVKLKIEFILRGIIDPTAEDFKKNTAYELLGSMEESLNLLQNLLVWARSESGEIAVIPETLHLADVVSETFRLLKLSSDHKQLTLINQVPNGYYVHADLNALKTVLRNLVSNAIKFTPPKGRITVRAFQQKEKCILEVEDNGQGIASYDMPNIMDPYIHYSKLGTQQEAGTGIGLALCKQLVQKNCGTLKVKSQLGQGSIFYFDMVLAQNSIK